MFPNFRKVIVWMWSNELYSVIVSCATWIMTWQGLFTIRISLLILSGYPHIPREFLSFSDYNALAACYLHLFPINFTPSYLCADNQLGDVHRPFAFPMFPC